MASGMADLRPFLGFGLSIFFWILNSISVAADPSFQELEALHLPSELEHLKSKISFLQSMIGERDYELRKKDQSILQLEKIIKERSDRVVTLEREIVFLKVNGSCLPRWLAVYLSQLQTFWYESGRPMANKAYRELLERKVQVWQWLKILAKIIVTEWIPNLTKQWLVFTTYMEPHVRCFATKTVDMYYKVTKYGVLQVFRVFQEWIPNLTKQWLVFATYMEPHVRCFATKTVDRYYRVKKYAVPQVFRVFQETREFIKPYIDQMVTVAKLRLENGFSLEPYQKNIIGAYQKIINFAASCHRQVSGGWHTRWLTARFSHLQSHWNGSGRPVANKAYRKLLESKAQIWQWLGIPV